MFADILTFLVLVCAFILFNCSFWIGQWSKFENDSQGLFEWCFNSGNTSCCESVSNREIETQGNYKLLFFKKKTKLSENVNAQRHRFYLKTL